MTATTMALAVLMAATRREREREVLIITGGVAGSLSLLCFASRLLLATQTSTSLALTQDVRLLLLSLSSLPLEPLHPDSLVSIGASVCVRLCVCLAISLLLLVSLSLPHSLSDSIVISCSCQLRRRSPLLLQPLH